MALIAVKKLIDHVGCGSVDELAACVLCDQIRARLRNMEAAEADLAALRSGLSVIAQDMYNHARDKDQLPATITRWADKLSALTTM